MFGGWRSSGLNKLDVMYLVYIHLGIGHLFYVDIRGDKAKQSGSQGSEVKWSEWTGTAVRSCGCFDAQAHHIIIGSYSKGLFNAAIQIRISRVLQSEMLSEATEKGNLTRSEPCTKL